MKRREFFLTSAAAVASFLMGAGCAKKTEHPSAGATGQPAEEPPAPATSAGAPENLTAHNLRLAYEAETQRSRKYAKFAEVAEAERQNEAALLFRGAEQAQLNQRKSHERALEELKITVAEPEAIEIKAGDTPANVDMLIGETELKARKYVSFEEQAEKDDNFRAGNSFRKAREADEHNASFFKEALAALKENKPVKAADYYQCPSCGYLNEGPMAMACPVCGTAANKFTELK